MENLLEMFAHENLDDADLIKLVFIGYENRRKRGELYSEDDYIPQNLIKLYFKTQGSSDFSSIVSNFKQKYIYNESELESSHDKNERDGLSCVYDYVKKGLDDKCPNIYVILILHSLLYSKVPCPEYGGKFRNVSACISNSDVTTTEPGNIPFEILQLNTEYERILKSAIIINETNNSELMMEYIDNCVALKCKLVKIHPFSDGNGRICRALVNLLLGKINFPPIYVKKSERKKYIEAMDRAIRLGDSSFINKFYYYKLCDSIIELDINERIKRDEKTKVKEK